MPQQKLRTVNVGAFGHYRNWVRPDGTIKWIAWRFRSRMHERRAEFETEQEAIDWLKQNPN